MDGRWEERSPVHHLTVMNIPVVPHQESMGVVRELDTGSPFRTPAKVPSGTKNIVSVHPSS